MALRTHGYPRPQFRRANWVNLNGEWEFAFDPDSVLRTPEQVNWNLKIQVPFSPETPASGTHNTGFFKVCWYRRTFDAPPKNAMERILLHFGAVDYRATIWVNGKLIGEHEGGYTPFSIDITDQLDPAAPQELILRAEDDPQDLSKPRGKQDWLLEPHSIWYPRTSGIWQTVWLERLPGTYIDHIRWTPNLELWQIGFESFIAGDPRDDLRLGVRLFIGNLLLVKDTYEVIAGEVTRRIGLSDPGIDDYRNELLWSPPSPTLIQAQITLWGKRGELIDKISSYTALRSIAIQGDRIVLNGRVYPLRLALDQGYWLDTGMTPPDDAALKRDVELVKSMGFNGVRKHQKIEDPRYLYWADRLGLLIWEEMPSAYRFTKRSVERLLSEWTDVIDRDYSHPCTVAWIPFNESWGVPNLPDVAAQRHYVQALYHLTKTLDPTRPVIGNDGWESAATDIIGIHDYDDDPEKLARRYEADERIPHLFKRERPGGRLLTLEGHQHTGQPIILTEFGGIAFSKDPQKTWGYSRAENEQEFAQRYKELLTVLRSLPLLAGFCYTQFADTYQETNGLLYMDRTPKFPIEEIALATRGVRSNREQQIEEEWRTRMLKFKREQGVTTAEEMDDVDPLERH